MVLFALFFIKKRVFYKKLFDKFLTNRYFRSCFILKKLSYLTADFYVIFLTIDKNDNKSCLKRQQKTCFGRKSMI